MVDLKGHFNRDFKTDDGDDVRLLPEKEVNLQLRVTYPGTDLSDMREIVLNSSAKLAASLLSLFGLAAMSQ